MVQQARESWCVRPLLWHSSSLLSCCSLSTSFLRASTSPRRWRISSSASSLCLLGFAAAPFTTLSSLLLLTLTSLLARGGVAGAGAGGEEPSLMAAALGALVRTAATKAGEETLPPPWPLLNTCCFIVCVNPRSSLTNQWSSLDCFVASELNTKCQKGRCCLGGWQQQACSMWTLESVQHS